MKWDMEMERIETVLERIWDLHDKISDAIHEISRAHLLKSIKNITQQSPEKKHLQDGDVNSGSDEKSCGYVFIKGFRADEDAALDETRSLDTIRSALENLEDQIEFFHTVQTQQQVERDAAMARLEQSRAILAMRLSEHQGEKRKVLEQAQALVLDIAEAGHFVAPEHLSSTREDGGPQKGLKPLAFMQALAKRSPGLDWLLGNAALFAVSALVLLQIHQATLKHSGRPRGGCSHTRRHTGEEIMLSAAADYFDVYSCGQDILQEAEENETSAWILRFCLLTILLADETGIRGRMNLSCDETGIRWTTHVDDEGVLLVDETRIRRRRYTERATKESFLPTILFANEAGIRRRR